MRVGFVQWPAFLSERAANWGAISADIAKQQLDLLITNELPFGSWIAARRNFDRSVAEDSIRAHEAGVTALQSLGLRAVITSRPVWSGDRLANEAILVEREGVRTIHRKQYFPAEPGWYETEWFSGDSGGFLPVEVGGLKVGVLLCTELMFNEHARQYGRLGANLIAVPRAVGLSTDAWLAAGKMAAIVSGSYVVSSNRSGRADGGQVFGGVGFAYRPDGSLMAMTSETETLQVINVDPAMAAEQQQRYPCYVLERHSSDG